MTNDNVNISLRTCADTSVTEKSEVNCWAKVMWNIATILFIGFFLVYMPIDKAWELLCPHSIAKCDQRYVNLPTS